MTVEILPGAETIGLSEFQKRKAMQRFYLQRVGENLRKVRVAKGLSLRGLAKACALDYSDIGKIEKGKINIGVVKLLELSHALEITPAILLDVSNETAGSADCLQESDFYWQSDQDDDTPEDSPSQRPPG
jgi:transcriptional regulator with XRE-family HTH domain